MVDCKILIIDDDEDDVETSADAFTKCSVGTVHYVFTAMQAFMYLQEVGRDHLPKVMVTDHFLPGKLEKDESHSPLGFEIYYSVCFFPFLY